VGSQHGRIVLVAGAVRDIHSATAHQEGKQVVDILLSFSFA
jgi:hypothetical protein